MDTFSLEKNEEMGILVLGNGVSHDHNHGLVFGVGKIQSSGSSTRRLMWWKARQEGGCYETMPFMKLARL